MSTRPARSTRWSRSRSSQSARRWPSRCPRAPCPPSVLKQVSVDGRTDEVAVELPLEIRLNGSAVAVTMRTPGHDFELAAGFLYGEGIVSAAPEMRLPEDLAANIVDAAAADAVAPATRRFYTTSSCGICGKGALEEVEAIAPTV